MQGNLFGKAAKQFGGSLGIGKRKVRRPLVTVRPMHVVLRAAHAGGYDSFYIPWRSKIIQDCLKWELARQEVRTYWFSINSNHLHLLIRGKSRQDIQGFLRSFPGRVSMLLNRTGKGRPLRERFWIPVFTRIVEWGRDFKWVVAYVLQNEQEAMGLSAYALRRRPLSRDKRSPN